MLLVDSTVGLVMSRSTRYVIRVSGGDPAKFSQAYLLVGSLIVIPVVLILTGVFAVFAAHRLQPHPRRWLWLGIGIYTVVRIADAADQPARAGQPDDRAHPGRGAVLTALLLVASSMIAERISRRTLPTYTVTAYFRRLAPEDRHAALALLSEHAGDITEPVRRR